jgi:hypothetical protein
MLCHSRGLISRSRVDVPQLVFALPPGNISMAFESMLGRIGTIPKLLTTTFAYLGLLFLCTILSMNPKMRH